LDFLGAIQNVTSLFTRICLGAKESRETKRQNSNRKIGKIAKGKNKQKTRIGPAQLNSQASGNF
jgi:hypothetical protein